MSDLVFYTNEQLLDELLNRATFRGLVIRQAGDFKGNHEPHWRWDFSNLNLEKLPDILSFFAQQIAAYQREQEHPEPEF